MHIAFDNLKLFGFMPFDEAEVNLKDNGFTLITGLNNNEEDKAQSNGAGKSSLISDSISWVLTGETVRGTKDVCNKNTKDGTSVELNFSIDKDNFKVIRYKEHKEFGTNLKIYVNGEDKSGKGIRDTEKILKEYLPDLTSDLLGSVIILGQGLPQRFTNNTPSGRKEVLEKLSKSDFMIQDIKDRLSKRKDTLNQEIRKIEDSLLESNAKLNFLSSNLTKLKNELTQLTKSNSEGENIPKLEINKDEINKEILSLVSDISLLQSKIRDIESNKNNIIKDENIEYNKIIDSYKPSIDDLSNKANKLDLEIKNLDKEIYKLKNVKDTCPTCGQKLPDIHKIDTTEMEEDLLVKESSLKQLREELSSKTQERDNVLKECRSKSETKYSELEAQMASLNKEKQEKESLKSSKERSLYELNSKIIALANYTQQKDKLEASIEEHTKGISELKEKILYYNIDQKNIKSHMEIVNKMSVIANRDFRGFLLTEVISFIDKKTKEYSQIIFETDKISFTLDGNNIDISYCGKQYENLSGGEKQRIDLIIQFSIRDMLSNFLDFSSNILLLDEIFDSLDSISCQQVINLISTKLGDVDSVYIITHYGKQLSIPYDKEITIVKDNQGISRLI